MQTRPSEFEIRVECAATTEEALALIASNFSADTVTFHRLGEDGLLHLTAATEGLPPAVLEVIGTIPVGKGMAGLAVERGQPVSACNIQSDVSGAVRPGARSTGLAGAVVVPVFHGTAVIGALGIGNRSERIFSEQEIDELMRAGGAFVARRDDAESSGPEILDIRRRREEGSRGPSQPGRGRNGAS
jgi:signal transduction protein with GAF and PtsI domain